MKPDSCPDDVKSTFDNLWPFHRCLKQNLTINTCVYSLGVLCDAALSFTLEPSDVIAVQEQPLMLHCQVDGIPPITTQWRHNGFLLPRDQRHTTFINGSLLIGHFQQTNPDGSSDEGDYECIAENSFGLVVSRKARIQAASKSIFKLFISVVVLDP